MSIKKIHISLLVTLRQENWKPQRSFARRMVYTSHPLCLFFVLFNLEILVKVILPKSCGFCLFGRAFDQLFFQKSNSPGVARGGGLIAVGFDSYISTLRLIILCIL